MLSDNFALLDDTRIQTEADQVGLEFLKRLNQHIKLPLGKWLVAIPNYSISIAAIDSTRKLWNLITP